MKKIIILFGVPGSGKGTQARYLSQKYHYKHISTGDLFRALEKNAATATQEEREALAVMKTGALVPSWLVYRLTFQAIIEGIQQTGGVVLDGAIRTVEQAQAFDDFFNKNNWLKDSLAVVLRLNDAEAYNRLTRRKICSGCGDIITWDKKLENITRCKKCGGDLIVRTDDNPAAARHRLDLQGNKVLQPILAYYKHTHRLVGADGARTIKQINQKLSFILEHYYLWLLLRPVKKLIKLFRVGK